ncbi:DUF4136 domain-containing protein [Tunturiibacter empetritectus]|uniref:DUF4136 domain-containing protein n=2 Tax=Tunturiibacter TaxID=3154218 RepID=A0A852VJ69_9BACT|nr:DUF4136 domain-containing protein [Edaphobacter lichenicola]NYF91670.1 hypothetical protein [Edaphobacter lichenicola]
MKSSAKILLLVAVTFLFPLIGHSQSVVVDWDHNISNFSDFKTYAWVKPTRPTSNPLMDQRIVAAIDSQLAEKGMRKVEQSPDVFVTYGAGVSQQHQAVATGMGGGWRRGGGMATVNQYVTNVGTLVVDINDGKTKELAWRGAAKDTLSDKPDKNSQKIDKAVAKMFKKYPPSGK